MQSDLNTHAPHWKDVALQKAEAITDAWEVAKAYAGRAAEWVLFACMIMNIIEMLPGISIPAFITNTVLGVQVVMLDIGGMSLGTMADHMREQGKVEAANRASMTSKFLIGLMIVTLLIVSIGILFPSVKDYMDMAEKGLILVRVVMTVIYSHVIHSLRSSRRQAPVPPTLQPAVPTSAELESIIRNILVPVLDEYRTETKSEVAAQLKQASTLKIDYREIVDKLQEHMHTQEAPTILEFPEPTSIDSKERKADRGLRLETAYKELLREGVKPTGQMLSARARCNRAVALDWLKNQGRNGESGEIEAVSMG